MMRNPLDVNEKRFFPFYRDCDVGINKQFQSPLVEMVLNNYLNN